MIASDRQALRVGASKLVVDGTDDKLDRKAEFSISPGRAKARRLSHLVALSLEVYNASLEHRKHAWRIGRVSVSRFDEFNEIPGVREARPDVAKYGNQFVRGSISRADEAFSSFFRRVRDGEDPGYPRFKPRKRFRSIFYDEPVSWALRRIDGTNPSLYVQGIGEISLSKNAARQLRRLPRRGGDARTLTITKTKSGSWRACIGFRNVSAKLLPASREVGGVDRGVSVTAALSDGTLLEMPGFLRTARTEIAGLQREREKHKKFGPEWKRLNRKVARAYERAHHQIENWARHTAIEITSRYGVISLEDLKLKNMTKSAKGTNEKPGKGVSKKKGLNRSLRDAALGRLAYWICVKAEEAGRRVWKVNPKNSSRECVACGHVEKENRNRSRFFCLRCRHTEHADTNAAQVLATRGEAAEALWREVGSPVLTRPVPRNLRRKATSQYGAGSAPDAPVA